MPIWAWNAILFLSGAVAMNIVWMVVIWLDDRAYYKHAEEWGEDD